MSLATQIGTFSIAVKESNWVVANQTRSRMALPEEGAIAQRVQVAVLDGLMLIGQASEAPTRSIQPRLQDLMMRCVRILDASKQEVEAEGGKWEDKLAELSSIAMVCFWSVSPSTLGMASHATNTLESFNKIVVEGGSELHPLIERVNALVGKIDRQAMIVSVVKTVGKGAASSAKNTVVGAVSSVAGWLGFGKPKTEQ
jgi:hypothetical protein